MGFWVPAFAGMTGRGAGMTGYGAECRAWRAGFFMWLR